MLHQTIELPYKLALNRTGAWEMRWTERGKGRSFTRTWSTGETDRAQADAKATEYWRERTRVDAVLSAVRVNQCAEGYLAARESVGVMSQRAALRYPLVMFGDWPVDALTPEAITDYRAKRMRTGLKTGSVRRELSALAAALNWAVKAGKISRDALPAHIERGPSSPPRKVWLKREEERDLWRRALETVPAGAERLTSIALYVTISLATAARQSAVLELTWAQIDFDAGLIDFQRHDGRITKKRRGVTPIADRLRPILERAQREALAHGEPATARVCRLVFIRDVWNAFLATTPYTHITAHDMRRTWASLAVQAGVPIYEVARVLSDTVATVEKNYGHLAPQHLANAVNAIW